MEVITGIGLVIFIIWATVKLIKFLWSEGIIQKALGHVAVALISGLILLSITGDPTWGVGGGAVLSVVSLVFFKGEA